MATPTFFAWRWTKKQGTFCSKAGSSRKGHSKAMALYLQEIGNWKQTHHSTNGGGKQCFLEGMNLLDKMAPACKSAPWSYLSGIFSLAVLMEKFDFSLYWAAIQMLEDCTNMIEKLPGSVNEYVPLVCCMPEIMTPVAQKLDLLNLTQSSIKARRIAERRIDGYNEQENKELKRQIEELQERIHDETSSQLFLYIPPNQAKYYENPQKYWEK